MAIGTASAIGLGISAIGTGASIAKSAGKQDPQFDTSGLRGLSFGKKIGPKMSFDEFAKANPVSVPGFDPTGGLMGGVIGALGPTMQKEAYKKYEAEYAQQAERAAQYEAAAGPLRDTAEGMSKEAYRRMQGVSNEMDSTLGRLGALRNDASFGARNELAAMLQQYSQGGNMPTADDTARSQTFARSQFDPQRVAMQQAFQDQLVQANRQAALSGRGVNDPILRAKLAQEQTRQNALLEAQQGAFATNFAMQQPGERLRFAEGRANVLTQNFQAKANLEKDMFTNLLAQYQGFGQQYQLGANTLAQSFNQQMALYNADLAKETTIAGGQYNASANQTSGGERFASAFSGALASAGAGFDAYSKLSSAGNKPASAVPAGGFGNDDAAFKKYYYGG